MGSKDSSNIGLIAVGGLTLIVLIVLLFSAIVIVPAGYEGVLLNWGAVSGTVLSPGIHFVVPVYQSVVSINTKVQAYTVVTGGTSQDLQQVPTEITLDFNINASQVNDLYQSIGTNYQNMVISPIVQEQIKAVEANFTAADLIDKRPIVQAEIQEKLSQVLPKYYIIVDQLSIVNFSFSSQFSSAIESKVAQQQVLEQQQINVSIAAAKANQSIQNARGVQISQIEIAEGNASAVEIKANATAYAANAIQKAIATNPDYLKYLQISEWNGKLPTVVSGSGTGALPLINLNVSGNSSS